MSARLSVLIVDDNRTSLALMDMLLRKLPNCSTQLQTDAKLLLAGLGRVDYDVAVLASRMKQLDGIALAQRLMDDPRLHDKPILLTADEPDGDLRRRAAEAGIADVLGKPINPVEFRDRILSLARSHHAAHAEAAWDDPAATSQISAREEEYLTTLVKVAGCRDVESPLHSQRMARYCAILAHNLGMPGEFCHDIRHAAPLHDIGKAGLSDALLRKASFLSPEERKAMEEHTRIGHDMLKGGQSRVFRMAAEIALTHHERWDGSGYPKRLRAEQIPLSGRIAAVADVFDALTSVRSYKTAWSFANALTYLHDNAGVLFDPACVAAFESARDEISQVMLAMPNSENDDAAGAADAA